MDLCTGSSSTLTAVSTIHQTPNGSNPFPIAFDCNGHEQKLSECSRDFLGRSGCSRAVSQLECKGLPRHVISSIPT